VSGAGLKGAARDAAGGCNEPPVERHFVIRKQIMLGFFDGREQYDVLIDPGQGKLMFNDRDIYWLIDGVQRLSDTINNAIEIWLRDGSIEEVLESSGAPTPTSPMA